MKEAKPIHGSVAIRVKTDSNVTAGRHFDVDSKMASIVHIIPNNPRSLVIQSMC